MKKTFTLLFSTLMMTIFVVSANAQINYIWGEPGTASAMDSQFDGGLNGWTTIGVTSEPQDSAANAVWEWTADGQLSNGSYWSAGGTIVSPSVANGAAGFDSDFLDNGGQLDAQGQPLKEGAAPSPHRGELISPSIDCSGSDFVQLKFNQSFRDFQAQTFVEVTNGTDSTIFVINEDGSSGGSSVINLDISSIAGNQSDVRVKFIFDGDYYYWIIDDVILVEKPDINLAISDAFYTPAHMIQPISQILTDTFVFFSELSNLGAKEQLDVVYKVQIFDSEFNEIFVDSMIIDTLAAGFNEAGFLDDEITDTVSFRFDTTFVPNMLDVGTYFISYSVEAPGVDDFDDSDNVSIETFFVSDNLFSNEVVQTLRSGVARNDGDPDYKLGSLYAMSPASQEDYIATEFTFACFDNDTPLTGRGVTLQLIELNEDELNGSFENFDFTQDATAENTQLNQVGINAYVFTADDQDSNFITADILDFDTFEPGVALKKGNRYFAVASYSAPDHLISHGWAIADDVTPPYHFSGRIAIWDADGSGNPRWFLGFQNSRRTPILRMRIALATTVDNTPLPEAAMKVFPNPTAQQINMQLDLEEASHATVTIADLSGRVLRIDEIENAKREIRNYNVGNFADGMYVIRLATEHGTRTLRFVVQH